MTMWLQTNRVAADKDHNPIDKHYNVMKNPTLNQSLNPKP